MSHWYLYNDAIPLSSAYSTYPTTTPAYTYAPYPATGPTRPTTDDHDSRLFDFDYRVAGRRVPWDSTVPVPMDMYDDDEEAPDVIIIKNRGASFTLHFRAYAIGDGILTVGDVREAAAARLGVSSARRVKLLYKGKLLKVDHVPAKQVGLKQNSQVLCVVSEDFGLEGSSSEVSVDEPVPTATTLHRRYSSRQGRPRRRAPAQIPPSANLNTVQSPLAKIEILEMYFDGVIEPLCLDYIEDPPVEQRTREFEHRRINETTMQQLMLKADAIDVEGDEYVRQRRKALIGKIERLLKVVDEVAKQ